jgi:hypothetical protein
VPGDVLCDRARPEIILAAHTETNEERDGLALVEFRWGLSGGRAAETKRENDRNAKTEFHRVLPDACAGLRAGSP